MSYFKFVNKNPRNLIGIVDYVKGEKRSSLSLVYGFGIDPEYAVEEMETIKKIWNQTDGRQYKHYIFSFDNDVTLPQQTLIKIGQEIGAYYADDYQILMAMHFDTNNIHIHYVLNTVNMFTGKKFNLSKAEIFKYKLYINQILNQYNLAPLALYIEDDGLSDGL